MGGPATAFLAAAAAAAVAVSWTPRLALYGSGGGVARRGSLQDKAKAATAGRIHNGQPPSESPPAPPPPPPPAAAFVPEGYETYLRMVRMGVPVAVVENKVLLEGKDSGLLRRLVAGELIANTSGAEAEAHRSARGDGGGCSDGSGGSGFALAATALLPAPPQGRASKATGARANVLADISKRRID